MGVAQAREILAFIEDQFVEWEPPYRHGPSSANCVASFLAMAKATGEDIWIDKARAIGDALTRMVEDDGFFNTWCVRGVSRFDERYHTWLNCTLETKTALDRLAALP